MTAKSKIPISRRAPTQGGWLASIHDDAVHLVVRPPDPGREPLDSAVIISLLFRLGADPQWEDWLRERIEAATGQAFEFPLEALGGDEGRA